MAVVSSPKEAWGLISAILALPGIHVMPMPTGTVAEWMDLLESHPVTGADVFDLQIVATMKANGIPRIYTFNTEDFAAFSELAVLTP